jgi:FG-GAP-like repeat/Polysaccharide lyase
MHNRYRYSLPLAAGLLAAAHVCPVQAQYNASKICPAVAPGDYEAYGLAVATGLGANVVFSTNWMQIPATGGWYGEQIMDGCRFQADGNVTWHGLAAARVEVQVGDDPLNLGENSNRAEMLVMQTASGTQIHEGPSSGMQFYATSYYFPPTWSGQQWPWSAFAPTDCSSGSQNQCNSWSYVMQFYGWAALMAASTAPGGVEHYSFAGQNFTTNGDIALGQWTDFVFQVNWGTGGYVIYRRDQGHSAFTQVLAGNNTVPSGGGIYYKQGLYRGGNVNGRTDVLWIGPTARGSSFAAVEQQAFGTNNGVGGAAKVTHDFNGDGKSDIAWRDAGGNVAVSLMNGAAITTIATIALVGSPWSIVGQRDFDGDGMADILWHDTSGNVAIWFMNGTSIKSGGGFATVSTVWSVAGTGDFNGDGKGDILWRDTSGNVGIWLMNGTTVVGAAAIGSQPGTWSIAGTGDFDGDGMTDILWHDTSGNVAIWFMNAFTVKSSIGVASVPVSWSIVGTGDFNGDGKDDILWRDTSGNVGVWLMNGAQIVQAVAPGSAPTSWMIAETGDYDGDGKSDILWRNTNGIVAIWFMNGTQVSLGAYVTGAPTASLIQGAGAD